MVNLAASTTPECPYHALLSFTRQSKHADCVIGHAVSYSLAVLLGSHTVKETLLGNEWPFM